MSDLISREYMKSLGATCIASRSKDGTLFPIVAIDELPPAEQPKERCVATITLSEKDLERIVKERVEEIKELLPQKGKWIDYSSEGFVECPFCHSATNCDGNKDELHYCFSCGAELR